MQLRKVVFVAPIQLRPGLIVSTVDGLDRTIVADDVRRVVVIDNTWRVPFERVLVMESGEENAKCPECGKTFANQTALGAHRAHLHGVRGGTRKEKQ